MLIYPYHQNSQSAKTYFDHPELLEHLKKPWHPAQFVSLVDNIRGLKFRSLASEMQK
jgi:hypothetical protein